MKKYLSIINILSVVIISYFLLNNKVINKNIIIQASFICGLFEILYLKYKKIFLSLTSSAILLIILSYLYKIFYLNNIMYMCSFLLIINLYKMIEDLNMNKEIHSYVLLFLIPYTIEKSLIYKIYDLKKEIILINFTLTMMYLYINFKNIKLNKELIKKNLLEEIQQLIILLYPFFLLKRGSSKDIGILATVVVILSLFLNKNFKEKITKKKEILIILSIISVLGIIISFFGNKMSEYTIEHFIEYLINIVIFISVLLINVKEETIKKLGKSIYLCSFLLVCNIFSLLLESNFTFGRISGFWNISTYSFTVGLLAILFLYMSIYYEKYRYMLITPILYVLVLFSGTRMIWLIVGVLSILICLFSKSIKVYAGMLVIGMILTLTYKSLKPTHPIKARASAYFNIKSNTSSGSRLYMYREAVEQFKEKPLTGNGYVTYGDRAYDRHKEELNNSGVKNYDKILEAYGNYRYHAHSNFFELLCGTGLIGIISFYGFNFYLFFILLKNKINKNKEKICDIGLLILLFYHMYGISDVTLYMGRVTEIYLWSMGIIISYVIYKKNNEFSGRLNE